VHTAEVLAPLAAASVSVALAAGVSAAPPVVVVDPGHDLRANPATEPIGPGSAVRKIKDGGGTAGEPQVVLAISLRLRTMLERAGVRVVMTRTRTAGTSMGNVARARIANRAGAVLFLRVHADGSSNAAQRGTHTLYPAARRGWTDDIAAPSLRAAQLVQVELVRALGLPDRGLDRRSDITGFNWSDVPAILPELGYLTNAADRRVLTSEAGQQRAALGLCRGALRFLGRSPNSCR
jgi:N-acetylmuramoyl-L-alanine amidase